MNLIISHLYSFTSRKRRMHCALHNTHRIPYIYIASIWFRILMKYARIEHSHSNDVQTNLHTVFGMRRYITHISCVLRLFETVQNISLDEAWGRTQIYQPNLKMRIAKLWAYFMLSFIYDFFFHFFYSLSSIAQ